MTDVRILIVDDEAAMVKTVRAYLEQEGYTVYSAADGVSALKAARALRPDLIVLDVMLPEMDGVELLRPQFEDKEVSLRVDVPVALPAAWADPGRITQVLINLLGNALQYTQPDGEVTVRAWCEGQELFVAVQDSGSGIGLTIAHHLVEAHGGRLWVASPGAGLGSTFTFSLPLVLQ